ncbi:hypothetical protein [Roseibium sp.]|uniref:hypothetical protein n=1 Tax=Roseibium sp. TaxID=1936156 RepID=UPI003BAF512A
MRLTLKKDATRPSGLNGLQQQSNFDAFMRAFNDERPHEALAMKGVCGSLYRSTKAFQGPPDQDDLFHDKDTWAQPMGGSACIARRSTSRPC